MYARLNKRKIVLTKPNNRRLPVKGLSPQCGGSAPFVEEQSIGIPEKSGHPRVQKYPETDQAMLRLAELLWTENFFRRIYPLLKSEIALLYHPRVLVKGLYLLNPRQRNMLLFFEKSGRELAAELKIHEASASALRTQSFRRLATAISDQRAFILSLGERLGSQSVPISLLPARPASVRRSCAENKGRRLARISAVLRPALDWLPASEELSFLGPVRKKRKWLSRVILAKAPQLKPEQANQKKLVQAVKNPVDGWKRDFLLNELGIKALVSKEDWREAFQSLSGSERDVVRFCLAKGNSFTAFSREKYGTPPYARSTYQRAKRKLQEAFSNP